MRKLLLAALFTSVSTFGAMAADVVEEAPIVDVPVGFSWTGAYVGAHLGWGWARTNVHELDGYSFSSFGDTDFKFKSDGLLGGVHVGYNWQFNQLVAGVEADISASGIQNRVRNTMIPGADESFSTDINWYGTVRGRLGYAADRFLPYVTGGVAFADVRSSYDDDDVGQDNHAVADGVVAGWTAGAGLEYALTDHLTLRAEYLYIDLGSKRGSFDDGGVLQRYDFDSKFHTARLGVSYKF